MNGKMDDFENRMRRNNPVFHGLNNSPYESQANSESPVIDFWKEKLNVIIPLHDIEHAHRIGHYRLEKCRPITVKSASYKIKEDVSCDSHKLKSTSCSITGNYTSTVQTVQRHFLVFGEAQAAPLSYVLTSFLLEKYAFLTMWNSCGTCTTAT